METSFHFFVELEGVEPSSKQGTNKFFEQATGRGTQKPALASKFHPAIEAVARLSRNC